MKKIFWAGVTGLFLFEIANVYFIMPMPGSQRMNSIGLAYFIHKWRWIFRGLFIIMIVTGLLVPDWKRKWAPLIPMALLAVIVYMANFKMAADTMFKQPHKVVMTDATSNKINEDRLVIGVEYNGEAKAYPVQLIGYHHHIQDTVGGKAVLVTYCTVCRTGRVYEPVVNGRHETFRLVGMDHFNAMLEDKTTKSWWRQATGEAIAGKLKGQKLPEVLSTQTSLSKWIMLHPSTTIMQADPAFTKSYDSTFNYESGKSKSKLTGTDSVSWNDKAWIIGITAKDGPKAYDWNRLLKERIITDNSGPSAVLLVLAGDNKSFFAFEYPSGLAPAQLVKDTLLVSGRHFRIDGKGIDTTGALKPVPAFQEFWHSWNTFHPNTGKY